VALLLRRRGITRVRPLAGGLEAWRGLHLPLEGEEGETDAPSLTGTGATA
jgi:3-mercaptopyruvate sulfurtransferase SseA